MQGNMPDWNATVELTRKDGDAWPDSYKEYKKRTAKKKGKGGAAAIIISVVLLVIALVLGVLFLLAYLNNDPFQTSSIETVEDDSYNKCLALVRDVRSQNFAEMIDDIIQMDGDYQDYNFLTVYEGLFKELIPAEGSDASAVKFRNCCFMVAYTEFIAKKYESYTDGYFGSMFIDDAENFRVWADICGSTCEQRSRTKSCNTSLTSEMRRTSFTSKRMTPRANEYAMEE